MRFLFPVLPVFLALAVNGVARLIRMLPSPSCYGASGAVAIAVTALFLLEYGRMDWDQIQPSFLDEDFAGVTSFLSEHTQPADTILFRKPRVIPLLAHRRALCYALQTGLGDFVQQVQPNYIIVTRWPSGIFISDAIFLWPYLREHNDSIRLVYENAAFRIYQAPH
jgi:hypothetical protein